MIGPVLAVTINNAPIIVRDRFAHLDNINNPIINNSSGLNGSGSFLVFVAKSTQFWLLALMMLPLLSLINLHTMMMSTIMMMTYRDLWDFRGVIFPCFCCDSTQLGLLASMMLLFAVYNQPAHPDDVIEDYDDFQLFFRIPDV